MEAAVNLHGAAERYVPDVAALSVLTGQLAANIQVLAIRRSGIIFQLMAFVSFPVESIPWILGIGAPVGRADLGVGAAWQWKTPKTGVSGLVVSTGGSKSANPWSAPKFRAKIKALVPMSGDLKVPPPCPSPRNGEAV